MWPFKRKEKEAQATARKPSPCGDDEAHYRWKDDGWPCPRCVAIKKQRDREADEDRLARKIATQVVTMLAKQAQERK